ncbi:hypothetical protein FQA39_LY11806 [Lamprigera yunnana]|nr:hypothetical protein FQA39_LY11806 [Lamprigera yunnana]
MQITEDTPPDMLAGAMDLTVHLPNGRMMKMSVERSTPMMDLLVQITTAHQLQQSGHILQALEMAPSTSRTDKVLPYKPNTPIGALDTQHVKVVPKHKSSTIPKNASVGHQPFESTFRLQVHLPRNQLYVVRVSQYVLLEDIMKKVCDEKNLDMKKYEFRHPGNLDEVLDPKLTLSDYQITEVYIVSKGTVGLTQAFSSNDIMVLKKEEERKQLQARTGGGVFSLIFKRGKSSMGSGSLSSDNRSISPSHSDDSRSVTPPAIQQILPVTQHSSNVEKPKPPQRKRRPAPKPPQQANARKESSDNPPSQISTSSETNKSETQSKTENGLTICHSRNSSDSSGYHEPSVLSDNCNLSLPRRTKPNIITEALSEEMPTVDNNKNNGNLSKMAVFSKSNISITSRKKKAAPPPPPILNSERIVVNPEKASPVVASPIIEVQGNSKPDETLNESDKCENKVVVVERVEELKTSNDSDVDIVDKSSSISVEVPATADPESDVKSKLNNNLQFIENGIDNTHKSIENCTHTFLHTHTNNDTPVITYIKQNLFVNDENLVEARNINSINNKNDKGIDSNVNSSRDIDKKLSIFNPNSAFLLRQNSNDSFNKFVATVDLFFGCPLASVNLPLRIKKESKFVQPILKIKPVELDNPISQVHNDASSTEDNGHINEIFKKTYSNPVLSDSNNAVHIAESSNNAIDNFNANGVLNNVEDQNKPQIVGVIPKKSFSTMSLYNSKPTFNSIGNKRGFKIGASLLSLNMENTADASREQISKSTSNISNLMYEYSIDNFDIDIFTPSPVRRKSKSHNKSSRQHHGIFLSDQSSEVDASVPSFVEISNIKRWNNMHDLDDISLNSSNSGFGGNSLSTAPSKESIGEILVSSKECTLSQSVSVNSFAKDSAIAFQSLTNSDNKYNTSKIIEADKVSAVPNAQEVELERDKQNFTEEFSELENEWQYHLPSPPTAFRDLTPTDLTDVTNYDTITIGGFKEESVITNPMLYQKLELIKDYRSETDTFSDMNSNLSEEERPMLNKLTLENLEKRKSLVYNRELSTSLKIAQDSDTSSLGDKKQDEVIHTHTSVIHELEEVIHSNGNKLLSRHNSYTNDLQSTYDNHLPNFKISTYNKPKSRINIFEDDSVRSNIENSTRSNSLSEQEDANVQITEAQDVETPTTEEKFKEPQEFSKYKVFSKNNFYVKHRSDTTNNVSRSESFSSNPNYNSRSWKPQNPVQRSKSQVALNNYKEDKSTGTDSGSLSKSNSLFDVSGLQSLEVMRIIQTKLNTPTNSTEQLLIPEETLEQDVKNSDNRTAEKSNENITTKMYKYQGPPAINLSTWSERPKTKVSLKEDTDYKINGTVSSGLPINNVSNNQETEKNCETHSVTVKINGTNHTTIQDTKTREHKFARFVNHALSTAYRKPLSNINKIESSGRPHSIAFPSEFDVSRLPIVRSVELKKPFKDNVQMNNKSITQINCSNNELANNFLNKYRNVEPSVEPVKEIKSSQYQNSKDNINIDVVKKPIQRVNSFAQSRIAPTVIGFRNIEIGNDNTPRSRKSWNVPNSYSTLPPKIKPEPPAKTNTYIPNNNVPFSQVTLRKVEVNNKSCRDDNQTSTNFEKVVLRNTSVGHKTTNYNRYSTGTSGLVIDDCLRRNSKDAQVPLPPPAPKVMNIMKKSLKTYQTVQDPRDDLLNSIRNFGGINGLRNINV